MYDERGEHPGEGEGRPVDVVRLVEGPERDKVGGLVETILKDIEEEEAEELEHYAAAAARCFFTGKFPMTNNFSQKSELK